MGPLDRGVNSSRGVIKLAGTVVFAVLCSLTVSEVINRYIFNTVNPKVYGLSTLLLGLLVSLTLGLTVLYDGHLTTKLCSLLAEKYQQTTKSIVLLISSLCVLFLTYQIAIIGLRQLSMGGYPGDSTLYGYLHTIFLTLGGLLFFMALAYKFFKSTLQADKKNLTIIISLSAVFLVSIAVAVYALQGTTASIMLILGIILLLILFSSGMSTGVAMILVGFLGMACMIGFEAASLQIGLQFTNISINYSFLLFPFLFFIAAMVQQSGMLQDMCRVFLAIFSTLPGGRSLSIFFVSAISSPTVFATEDGVHEIGKNIAPEENHSPLTIGSLAAGGVLPLLLLPSLLLAIIGILTEQSINMLFLGAISPFVVITALFFLYILIAGFVKPDQPIEPQKLNGNTIAAGIIGVILLPSIFLLNIRIIGLGIMTPVENASFIIIFVMILSLITLGVTGRPIIKAFNHALQQTLMGSGKIFLLLIGASIFSQMMNTTRITANLMDFVISTQLSPIVFIIVLILSFIILASFFESLSLIAVSIPVIFPLAMQMGFDPVWFAVILATTIGVSYLLPPAGKHVGVLRTLYPALNSKRFLIGTAPFLFMALLVLLLLILFPQIITTLPKLLYG